MTMAWEPVTIGAFTVRELGPSEFWSETIGDATAETIVEETAWEGASARPGSARAMIEGWQARGASFLGLYREGMLIGLFDVGRPTSWAEATGEKPDGAGDLLAEPVATREPVYLTLWYSIRPAARGQIPADVFTALSGGFLRQLWDLGIRRMVAVYLHTLAEGRALAAKAERWGWRTLAQRGLTEIKVKRLERRP
jgi:hypothetical protein